MSSRGLGIRGRRASGLSRGEEVHGVEVGLGNSAMGGWGLKAVVDLEEVMVGGGDSEGDNMEVGEEGGAKGGRGGVAKGGRGRVKRVTSNSPGRFLAGYIGSDDDEMETAPLENRLHPYPKRVIHQNPDYEVEFLDYLDKDDPLPAMNPGSPIQQLPAVNEQEMVAVPLEPPVGEYCNSPSQESARSPAANVSCGSSTPPFPTPSTSSGLKHFRRPLTKAEISNIVNYGSEDDSDDEGVDGHDDMPLAPPFIPRAERMFFADLLEEQEARAADPVERAASPPPPPLPEDDAPAADPRFQFDWRSCPSPPIPPAARREVFNAKAGPRQAFGNAYEAFTAIWDRQIMELIASETNKYAQQTAERRMRPGGNMGPSSRLASWRDTDADELYLYFAVLISFGICIRSDIKEYWAHDSFWVPQIGNYISQNRFYALSSNLHFHDNRTDIRTLTKPEAKLAKIQPIIDHLNSKFQSLYDLSQSISIDESLTQWKGWLNIKQYIKNKAAVVGIKSYELCEAQTGYLWRFEVYAGQKEILRPGVLETPLSKYVPTLVNRLLTGLEGKGHTVFMDNFYNSPALARDLKAKGFDCVGTLRLDRQCVPVELKSLDPKSMPKGQIHSCTSGDVDIVVWKDSNRVTMISTYHGDGVHKVDGNTKPAVVVDYNVCMGGVDKKDQMLSTYPLERKRTKVWYKKYFRRLLNSSILNALIMYRGAQGQGEKKALHRHFRKSLVKQLVERHHTRQLRPGLAPVVRLGKRASFPTYVLDHMPVETGLNPKQPNSKLRMACVVCHMRRCAVFREVL